MKGNPNCFGVGGNPFETGVNVAGFFWPKKISKLLQKGMIVPNFKEIGKNGDL